MQEGRRRAMFTHQMSVIKRPPNYHERDNHEEDDDENEEERHGTRTPSSARSYGFVEKESSTATSRTLFDIIQNEESSAAFAYKGVFGHGSSNKLNWKSFKDRLRIRRTGSAWNSSGHSVPISDDFRARPTPISDLSSPKPLAQSKPSPRSLVRNESRMGRARIEEEEDEDEDSDDDNKNNNNGNNDDDDESEGEARGASTVVSLMSLLEQTGNEEDEEQEEEYDDDEEAEEDGGEKECVCCVCMVRHKASAFSPCGHNFCRLCSRELWVSKGNCPLCNGYIYEILNVF